MSQWESQNYSTAGPATPIHQRAHSAGPALPGTKADDLDHARAASARLTARMPNLDGRKRPDRPPALVPTTLESSISFRRVSAAAGYLRRTQSALLSRAERDWQWASRRRCPPVRCIASATSGKPPAKA